MDESEEESVPAVGAALHTRDGRVVGNAVVTRAEGGLVFARTDRGGDVGPLTAAEVQAWWRVGTPGERSAWWRRARPPGLAAGGRRALEVSAGARFAPADWSRAEPPLLRGQALAPRGFSPSGALLEEDVVLWGCPEQARDEAFAVPGGADLALVSLSLGGRSIFPGDDRAPRWDEALPRGEQAAAAAAELLRAAWRPVCCWAPVGVVLAVAPSLLGRRRAPSGGFDLESAQVYARLVLLAE